jgi:glycosyltransferase involved in cell wall biosynthesis
VKFNIVTENFVGYLSNLGTRGKIFGGAEIILYDLCKLVQRHGHGVTVIQYGSKHREFEYNGIPVRQVKAPSFRVMNKFGITRRFHGGGLFWKGHLDKDVDRVHFHYYYLGFPYGDESMTGFSHGIDWDCPWYKHSYTYKNLRDRFSFWMMQKITGKVLRQLKKIVANDTNFLRYVSSAYPDCIGKVDVVPNYVDTGIFNPSVSPDCAILDRFQGKTKILLPKMPAYERGTDIAIRAIARLRRHDIILMIVGESASKPVFMKMAQSLGISTQVVFLGHHSHVSEMPGLFAAADIVIVPSPCREATALSVLEGMAMGKPVIASKIGGIPEIFPDDGAGFLIKPVDIDLADAIALLVDNPSLRGKIGRRACAHIRSHFTKELWEGKISLALELT